MCSAARASGTARPPARPRTGCRASGTDRASPIAGSAEAMAREDRRPADAAVLRSDSGARAWARTGVGAIDPASRIAVDRALTRAPGIVRFSRRARPAADRPRRFGAGLLSGHRRACWAPQLGRSPFDADVANAIGAVVGQVRASVTVFVTAPEEGIFIVGGTRGKRALLMEERGLLAERASAPIRCGP